MTYSFWHIWNTPFFRCSKKTCS